MRILQVYKDYYPPVRGGVEGHINLLANGLKKRDNYVEVLVSNTRRKLETEIIDSIKVTKVPQITRVASAPLNYSLYYWIKQIGINFDVLHFHLPNPTAVISFLISGLKKKTVVTYHSDIVRQRRLATLYRPFLISFLNNVDWIIPTSPDYVESSNTLCKYKHKCHVVPLGVDLSRFNRPSHEELNQDLLKQIHGDRMILFIGKFRYYKGLHVLFEAMNQVDGKLLLIGEGYLEEELKKKVAVDGLVNKVEFLGELSNRKVNAYLKACDVFVLPSVQRSEAFGIVQLEAMACGKPVVCTDLGTGTTYVNQHQKTGIVVAPDDPLDLAQAINFLLDNPKVRFKFGQAGSERVKKYFTADRMVDDIIALYEKCLNSN